MEKKKAEHKEEPKPVHHVQSNETIEIPIGKWLGKVRTNPWIVATFFLAIALIVVIVWNSVDGSSSGISSNEAAQNVVAFINSNPDLEGQVSLVSAEKEGSLFKVTLNYQGQDVPVYTTMDGKFLVSNVVPIDDSLPAPTGNAVAPPADSVTPQQTSEDDDPVMGNANAPITIIEFSDYQCPYCERFWSDTLPSIKKDYIETGKAKLVFRDYPLSFHPMAEPSAIAAECVRKVAKTKKDEAYFKYHDKLFENQQSLSNDNLKKWAKELGYNIDTCLDNQETKAEVQKDLQDGGSLGTPTFFINGVKVEGAMPYSSFKQIIDAQLAKA